MMLPESVRTCLSFAVLQRRLEQREAEYKNFQYILDEVRSILRMRNRRRIDDICPVIWSFLSTYVTRQAWPNLESMHVCMIG
jgi:hypothetical protein